jgi:Uncharacterized conserved protein
MQEHFNENYVESDKYPKAAFRGMINDLTTINFSKNGAYPATVTGKLTLHGETKDISAPVTIYILDGKINVSSEFKIALADFKISVPALVRKKVEKK